MTKPAKKEIISAALKSLWSLGYGRLRSLLEPEECTRLRELYRDQTVFRSRVEMQRYRFGKGEYQYFSYPLPISVQTLRKSLYAELVETANRWSRALGAEEFPPDLESFLGLCHANNQKRPTPLILRYGLGDYNCLHQDVYGELTFPFQVICSLSRPDKDFTGGELLLVEQRPRSQSIGHSIRLEQGEAVVITTRYRPVEGARGFYRTNFRHGVSPIHGGERYTLGIIFHDSV